MKKTLTEHYGPTRDDILKALGAVSEIEYNKMWRSLDGKTKEINELVQKVHILEKRLEVSEKEHYRTLERLRIATKALKKYESAAGWGREAFLALKEMEGVK